MKPVTLHFFSPQDNSQPTQKGDKQTRKTPLTGSISASGKLILPLKTVQQLFIDSAAARFKVGIEQGKRKIKSLYLIPANEDHADTFELVKNANSYSIALALILRKGGVYYQQTPHVFTIHPFQQEDGVRGYELRLHASAPKPPYTGKPRGRQAKKNLPTPLSAPID